MIAHRRGGDPARDRSEAPRKVADCGADLVISVDGVTTMTYVDLDAIDFDDPSSVEDMVERIREMELEGRALRSWWAAAVEAENA